MHATEIGILYMMQFVGMEWMGEWRGLKGPPLAYGLEPAPCGTCQS